MILLGKYDYSFPCLERNHLILDRLYISRILSIEKPFMKDKETLTSSFQRTKLISEKN